MRPLSICSLAVVLMVMTISCGENKPASSGSLGRPTDPVRLAAPQDSRAPIAPAAVPPKAAQWTIYCATIPGPGHVERSKKLKEDLIRITQMNGWYVTHEERQSTLFYGYYRSYNDPKDAQESARIRGDRERVVALKDAVGNHPYGEALPVPIASPDPSAPPEYNLLNAKGYWSLQIAAYQGPGRKEAAVEAVREARKMGVEAYYHHGQDVSEVCIGSWAEEAVKKQDSDSAQTIDPSVSILALGPGADLPGNQTRSLVDRNNRPVRVLEQKIEVVDPTMLAAMRKYPNHALNGEEEMMQMRDRQTGKPLLQPKPSVLVQIPHPSDTILQSGTDRPTLLNPQPGAADQQPGFRRLGSFEP